MSRSRSVLDMIISVLNPGPTYTRGDLFFVKEPPEEISIECPICLNIMLKEPSQTSCGHHFCTSCIEKVHGSCPKCRATSYKIFPDADRQRYISGLQVYCSNKKDGCTWKGELKNLADHINKDKRNGDCKFEIAVCRQCITKMKRIDLDNHEESDCPERPWRCRYCGLRSTYKVINYGHYDSCPSYPIHCPNKCDKIMPRKDIKTHVQSACPLQQVKCDLSWAGCTVTTQRKDVEAHIASNPAHHIAILARACEKLKEENAELKKNNLELQRNYAEVKKILRLK